MSGISRRRFLAGLGAGGALAASGLGVWAWRRDEEAPAPAAGSTPSSAEVALGIPGRTLVILELAGGNDALSMIVPHGDPRYRDLRPSLAVTDPIDLDGTFGLAPSLRTVAGEYAAGRVAVVHGVGLERPDLSHFESFHRWWTADADTDATGWLGRYLDATVGFDDPLAAISIGAGPSPALAGASSFATAIADARGLRPDVLDEDVQRALLAAWGKMVPDRPARGLLGDVQRAIGETLEARDRLTSMLAGGVRATRPRGGSRPVVLSMRDALTLAARLAAGDAAPRIVYVQAAGDFDTHQGQAARHDALMRQLDEGVAAFLATLDELGARDRAVLATVSEFGRRARENGTGTDHGTAAAHLVVGSQVTGGMYGEPPSLRALDDAGNLVPTTMLRDYYATLLAWLGVDAQPVVGGAPRPLPLF